MYHPFWLPNLAVLGNTILFVLAWLHIPGTWNIFQPIVQFNFRIIFCGITGTFWVKTMRFKGSHTKAQKNKHTLRRNDVIDMRPGLKGTVQNGDICYFFSIGIAPTSEAKTMMVTSIQCELFIADRKKYMILEWPSASCPLNMLVPFLHNYTSKISNNRL